MATPEKILAFWLDEVGPEGWYKQDDALDDSIRQRFGDTWQSAMEGRYGLWLTYPSGVLAYIILLDQFPRNMFRGSGDSFLSDPIALAAAKQAIRRAHPDAHLTLLSTRANDVMKVLTIFASIFVPLTFVAGVYGMNFQHMPELAWPWAYPVFWGVILVMTGGMLVFFRRKKWL